MVHDTPSGSKRDRSAVSRAPRRRAYTGGRGAREPRDNIAQRRSEHALTEPPRRVIVEAVVAGAAVVSLHLAFRLSALIAVGAFNDDGVYVALGRALAEGSGYRLIHLVGAPVAVKFPPGLPAVLALAWAATGSLPGVRAVIGVLQPLVVGTTVALLWWVGRRRLGATPVPLAVLVAGPFALDPMIQYLNLALAEPEFLLGWATVGVLALPVLAEDPCPHSRRTGRLVALGATLAVTTLFRTAGIVLIVAVLAAGALRRRWRAIAIIGVTTLAPLAAWTVLHARLVAGGPVSTLPDETGYWQLLSLDAPQQFLTLLPVTVWDHARAYWRSLGAYLLTPVPLGMALVAAGGAAAVAGGRRHWRDGAVVPLSVAGMLGAALIWPFLQERFALVVLPFAGLLAAAGVERAISRTPTRWRPAWHLALVFVAVAVGARQGALRRAAGEAFVTREPPEPADFSPAWFLTTNSRFIYEVSGWVRDHTGAGDRLMVDSPAGIFLHTGRRTMQASPAQSELAPPIFAAPGRYLAGHIRTDSISIVVVGWPGAGLASDVRALDQRCPGVLAPWDGRPIEGGGFPRYYRVTPTPCLDALTLSPP